MINIVYINVEIPGYYMVSDMLPILVLITNLFWSDNRICIRSIIGNIIHITKKEIYKET